MELLNLSVVRDSLGSLLHGLQMTIVLTLIVISLSAFLAIPVAVWRMSTIRAVRLPATWYVEIMRATPLVLQLIYIFYVLPGLGIRLDVFTAAIIGLTLHYAAVMSEVYRAGIQAIGRGQWDAAGALGMTRSLAFRRIILPQAFRVVTPALGNYFISLFKDTSLASVLTLQELMFTGQIIAARNYQYFTIYTLVGILYFGVGYTAAVFVRRLERRLAQGYSRKRKRSRS
jgi:His/Glu/Gln/Arg/opine family amino acid ABC transporter permease subunit